MQFRIMTMTTEHAAIYKWTTDDANVFELRWHARRGHDVDATENIEMLVYTNDEPKFVQLHETLMRIDAIAKEMTK